MAGNAGGGVICADTSSMVAYFQGEREQDVEFVDRALADHMLALAPVSITELLSNPNLTPKMEGFIFRIPQLEIKRGYWERVGNLRAKMFRHSFRHKLADSLIAQTCLDHAAPLITRDRDFLAFQKVAGLRILPGTPHVQ